MLCTFTVTNTTAKTNKTAPVHRTPRSPAVFLLLFLCSQTVLHIGFSAKVLSDHASSCDTVILWNGHRGVVTTNGRLACGLVFWTNRQSGWTAPRRRLSCEAECWRIYCFTAELHCEEKINFSHISSSVVLMLWLISICLFGKKLRSHYGAHYFTSSRGEKNESKYSQRMPPPPCKFIKRWQPSHCIDICTIIIILLCM